MAIWDILGNIQSRFKTSPGAASVFPDGRVSFGTSLDIARTLPANPQSWNDKAERARLALLEGAGEVVGTPAGILAGATLGTVIPGVGTAVGAGLGTAAYGLAELDKKTEGKVSNALMAGSKNLRSNYAFVSDAGKHDAGLGLLASIQMIAGGALGAIAGAAIGGVGGLGFGAIPGAVAGFAVGAGITGRSGRKISEAGMVGETLQKSALLAKSEEGQKLYNFGSDVTRLAGEVVGVVPGQENNALKDPNYGIGAVIAGFFNFGLEATAAPDIKGVQLAGIGARAALVGGTAPLQYGLTARLLAKTQTADFLRADKIEGTIELINKTVAGEKTAITPIMEFYKNNDVPTLIQRAGLKDNPAGLIAANLVAGKDFDVQGLVMRVGIGDATAIAELEARHPATFAELLRQEGIFDTLDARNPFGPKVLPQHDMLKGRIIEAETVVKAEIQDLRNQYSWLNKALKLDTAFEDRGFAVFSGVEKLRNDMARQRSANKMAGSLEDITSRETAIGNIVQKVYQRTPFSAVIRFIERNLDDAPHATVNFNDALQSTSRVRTTLREAITLKVLPEIESKELYNAFVVAKTETERLTIIKKIEERVFEQVANKYGIPASIKEIVLANYVTLTRQNMKKAREAQAENNAFMIENGEIIRDPQLITQLANGSYLPDVALIDKAFARYAKKRGAEASLPVNAAIISKVVVDEFQSLWRTFTLARTGFPINIVRDSTLRTWGDGVLIYSLMNLSKTGLDTMLGAPAKVSEMRRWAQKVTNRKSNLDKIRDDIKLYDNTIKDAESGLKSLKYNPEKPPKDIPDDLARNLKLLENSKAMVAELRRQENAIVKNIPSKIVGPDKINVEGYDFPAANSGRFGEIAIAKLRGKDDIRALVASTRELEMAAVRRDRDGAGAIKAVDNEDVHLRSWDNVLNNILRNDEVSREIMIRNSKNMDPVRVEQEVVSWIRSSGSRDLFERFGYDANFRTQMKISDAKTIYQNSLAAINQFAPDVKLQKLVIEDKANILELKKMYPDITKRPDVISDLALDLTGQSTLRRKFSQATKDVVTWLATVPPSILSYNPYYQAKYELKLQSMVATANSQGRKLSEMNQRQFEATARDYALSEFRAKINAFNRDMNYQGWLDHVFAFFPAVVEQYRAYGRMTLEHPEFPLKIVSMSNIPDYLSDVKVDQYGTEYTEVTLPVLGITGRLPVSWFNAVNPTGGHILSASPIVTAAYNQVSQSKQLPKFFNDLILPFGTQANAFGALTPSTIRRAGQAFQAFVLKNGDQFNKDMNMFIELKRKEFVDTYGVEPSGTDLNGIYNEAKGDTMALSVVRALGAGILPSQPRYVSPIEQYADLLGVYLKNFGAEGTEKFVNDYPEYFMLADKLTDTTSGIRQDDTAVALVKKNGKAIEKMVSNIEPGNLSVLGAVFNDDDYAFSSSARAYLIKNTIPGTSKRFQTEADALDVASSSIVNKGWREWNKVIEIVSQQLQAENISPASGYGRSVLDMYKKNFIADMKTKNNLWFNDKESKSFSSKRNNTIDALTIAANTPELWADLGKQQRWHSIAEYLNFRYYIKEELERRDTSITSDKAIDLRQAVDTYVFGLRSRDVNFGKFYDRYLENDEFDHVFTEVVKGEIK